MWRETAVLGLWPLLLAQGRRVRRETLRLPEPAGPRAGEQGAGTLLRLLIVGDSAAAGVGVATQAQALSGQLVSRLATESRVCWRLLAQTGYTARDVVCRLAAEPDDGFDVAVTSIGVNDVTDLTRLPQWLASHDQLVDMLETRFGVRRVLLSALPPMHAFPALPDPLRWYLGLRARRFDQALRRWAQSRRDCEVVSTAFPVEPGFMADDGFHPGAAAYTLWADHLANAIRHRLA